MLSCGFCSTLVQTLIFSLSPISDEQAASEASTVAPFVKVKRNSMRAPDLRKLHCVVTKDDRWCYLHNQMHNQCTTSAKPTRSLLRDPVCCGTGKLRDGGSRCMSADGENKTHNSNCSCRVVSSCSTRPGGRTTPPSRSRSLPRPGPCSLICLAVAFLSDICL
jgi:hypothetical protein